MADAAFNTIAEIQRLRDAGLPQEQAEAITLSIHSGVTGGVATKADLEKVETALSGKIKTLGTRIDTEAKALDTRIDAVEERLTAEIKLVRKDVEALDTKIETSNRESDEKTAARIANAKFELTWRLLGGIALLNGLMFALMRYMPPPG